MKCKSVTMILMITTLLAFGFFRSSAIEAGNLASQKDPFTNEDVLTMIKAGFAQETIVEAIRSNEPGFDTSVEGLLALKEAGVGEDLIKEILAAVRAAANVPTEAGGDIGDGLPSEDGVYALVDGAYVPLEVERIEWRSAIFSGRTTVGSLVTTAFNARLPTLHSPFELSGQPEMILVCAECESAFDYHLVLANDEDDKREFRISFQILQGLTEVFVARGGTGKEKIEYGGEKLFPGKYKLELTQLAPGDYAFLPPSQGPHPQMAAVMHTFRLIAP